MHRVLSLSTLYPRPDAPRFGAFVARQMEALAARGDWDVVVVNPLARPPLPLKRYASAAPEERVDAGVRVFHPRFPMIPKLSVRWNPALIARAVLPLARRLHAEVPFDLVDAQFFYPDGPAAARIADALRLPLTIKARGSDIHLWGAHASPRRQMLAAGERAAVMLAVSASLREDMVALGLPGERIAVHHTGLDRSRFQVVQRAAARQLVSALPSLHVWSRGPLLVSAGALIPLKGHRLTLRALAELPDARLAIAGVGPEEPTLRALARELGVHERVQFLGAVDHESLALLFAAADAMVLPSEREGLANVWLEALACGAPLVIADVGGAREVVTDPQYGGLVAREPGAIAAAVRALLADPPSQAAVAAGAERFSWARNAAGLAAAFERAVSAR